ncbi:unnamed protein product [Rhizophagus irregularis]|uniref:Uncharacterized protein n=1 Tax=Rhizophagus irregularis TaxID=588596 RepID=A0A915ZSV4_9GLOM|nr:unnamed protein product [Rhizophagus irregularis]CAB5386883.1 unnamed protein product [Rhizophagus irregularis]
MNFLISLWQLNDFVPYRGILKIQHNMLLIVKMGCVGFIGLKNKGATKLYKFVTTITLFFRDFRKVVHQVSTERW